MSIKCCKNCSRRDMTCHIRCLEYIKEREEHKKEQEHIKLLRDIDREVRKRTTLGGQRL